MDHQTGKDYTPKTAKGKEMAKVCVSFCQLPKSNANAIVVNFDVTKMNKLADFCKEHWNDMSEMPHLPR